MNTHDRLRDLEEGVHRLEGRQADYDPLLELIGDARIVLLGEASHGTHKFYRERARMTKRLITEKGFIAVAAEADWPDAYRIHRYVSGRSPDRSANEALGDFKRFPTWMWRNTEVLEFVQWLRAYNETQPHQHKAGFYGLDLYSLHASMQAVLRYLQQTDPAAAARARSRYACFDHFGEDTQQYGLAAGFGLSRLCEDEAVAQLMELRRHAEDYLRRDGFVAEDEFFMPSRMLAWCRTPSSITGQCFKAMFRPGICATTIWRRPCMPCSRISADESSGRRSCSGSTILIWGMPGRHK